MKLHKVRLVNIRTYRDETISFDSGITLLCGDIGSGKSSILLAVEFALFGSSRSDLPAEALISKGASSALVDLWFEVNGKEVSIRRTLNLTKNGIRQGPGHLIVNGVKKDLTPIELKAEIIELLGYPKDLAGRGKNYVYRYTVYCPQEEMKHILQESSEARLDILRKLFGIEKYKTVRDNLQVYLKDMRKEKLILQTRLEPLEGFRLQQQQKVLHKTELTQKVSQLRSEKETLRMNLDALQKHVDDLLHLQTARDNSRKELAVLLEKEKGLVSRRLQIEGQMREISEELSSLLLDESMTFESVAIEVSRLEKELRNFREKKVQVESSVKTIQEKLSLTKTQLSEQPFDQETHNSLITRQGQIKSQLKDVDLLTLEKQQLELETKEKNILQEKSKAIAHFQSLQEGLSSVLSLGSCPTCKQDVSSSHKEHISNIEQKKITALQQTIKEYELTEVDVKNSLKTIKEQITNTRVLVDEQKTLESTVRISLDRQARMLELRISLKESVVANNSLMKEMAVILEEEAVTVPRLEQRLVTVRQMSSKLETKRQLLKHKTQLETELANLRLTLEQTISTKELLTKSLQENTFDESALLSIKKTKQETQHSFERQSVCLAEHQVSLEHCQKEITDLNLRIKELEEVKSILTVLSEQLHWLSSYFMNLTYTIEKEIMLGIYHRFNELFVHWFSMLMSGGEVSARLDSNFTPIIEQNGHEISFAYLSGGERTAASLAYRLSLNKVINDVVHDIRTKDLIMLDEPSDGFSSEQLDRLRDVLENLQLGQVIIVSHEATVEGFVNRVLRVEKTAGHSSVIS